MKDTLVLFNTKLEAQATLDFLLPTPLHYEHGLLFETEHVYILVSGMGEINTLNSLYQLPIKYSRLIYSGVIGALDDKLSLGDSVFIKKVSKYLSSELWQQKKHDYHFHKNLYPSLTINSKGYDLISAPYPIHNREEKENLSQFFQLVDLESYAVAHFAKVNHLEFMISKIVSDTPSKSGDTGEIPQRIKTSLSQLILKELLTVLAQRKELLD
ncbi:MAG: hypothetical protein GWP59_04010, partial [Chlamydiales bacterium]|nr:hypothetical protein [Chlamydiales bacterium]